MEFLPINWNFDHNNSTGFYGVLNRSNSDIFYDNRIRGSILGATEYQFDRMRFLPGSEHTIDGKRYDMEAQFTFFNVRYLNYEEARVEPKGLAVISILFQATDDLETDSLISDVRFNIL